MGPGLLLALRLVAADSMKTGQDGPPEPAERAEARAAPEPATYAELTWLTLPTGALPEIARDRDDRLLGVRILVDPSLADELEGFAQAVADALGDPAGWRAAGRDFAWAERRARYTFVLARPERVDVLCAPLRTGGVYSCGRAGRAVINADRWRRAVGHWPGTLDEYRRYVINHELGHLLGQPHRPCPGPGLPAPIMQQQSIALGDCTPGLAPSADELARLRARWAKRR